MKVGVVRERREGERRVALTPEQVARLRESGFTVYVETEAGASAFFPDEKYREAGAQVLASAQSVVEASEVLLRLHTPSGEEIHSFPTGKTLIGILQAWRHPEEMRALAQKGWTVFALERLPRITRAQSMDVLSSMAALAGYKAVLLAADHFVRVFPMLTTAAGTLVPARVLVIGVGVAGLQAIATARRLGAQVEAYDIRLAAKEQVESLGAKFLPLTLKGSAETEGGYARALTPQEQAEQQKALAAYVGRADVVITTASVPGQPAPRLITAEMRRAMRPGSVLVDLVAEAGGNCEETCPGQAQVLDGVVLLAPVNLPATLPVHASQMLARNFAEFLGLFRQPSGRFSLHTQDEILRATCLFWQGQPLPQNV